MHSCFNAPFLQLYHRGAVVKRSLFLYLSNLLRSAPWIFTNILLLSSLLSLSLLMKMSLFFLDNLSTAFSSIFCCHWWVRGCQVCCCCCLPLCQHLMTIESQSTNLHLSQNQCRPCNRCRGGGGRRGEAPTCNACLLFAVYNFIVGVISFGVFVLLHAVIDNLFIDDRKPDPTVRPSSCILDLILD
jgi:hypothetical protein